MCGYTSRAFVQYQLIAAYIGRTVRAIPCVICMQYFVIILYALITSYNIIKYFIELSQIPTMKIQELSIIPSVKMRETGTLSQKMGSPYLYKQISGGTTSMIMKMYLDFRCNNLTFLV